MSTYRQYETVIRMLLNSPDGLTAVEIATQLNMTRQGAYSLLNRMVADHLPIYTEDHRYFVLADQLHQFSITTGQAWFLYMLLRRTIRMGLARHSEIHQLLGRLTRSLHHEELANVILSGRESSDTDKPAHFDKLVTAWQQQCTIEIYYQPLRGYGNQHTVAPWWFEPAVWSDGLYMIAGRVDKAGNIRSQIFKMDRIRHVGNLGDRIEPPDAQTILEWLEGTWGIWMGEKPDEVKLRFHYRQRQRLDETRWHPDQTLETDDEGYILWTARVAEPREMISWIRGWGPDVEVLDPAWLRDQIAEDMRRSAELYKQSDDDFNYFD